MAEQEVTGISGQLALDITQWSEAIDAAKSELRGLTQAAGSVAVNVRAPKAAAATGRQGMAVTPAFSVTQHAVRDLRADINQTLRAHAGQGQAVGVPIKLGRVAWGAIRTQIAAEIGVIPIKVSIAGVAGGSSKNVLAAMMSVSTGSTMGKAQSEIESAAASRGIPKRASGGPAQAHRPIVVGDAGRAEVYVPDSHGRVYPSLSEWRRRENELRLRNLAGRNSPTHAEIDSELHDRYRFAFRARGGNVSPVNAARRESAFDITHRYGNIKGWQNQMWRQQEAAENAERFESAQREESWASEMWSLRSGRARAQGGPAHKGGLPRGYSIEFLSPIGEEIKMPQHLTIAGRVERGLKPVGKPIFKGKPGYRSEMSALYGLVKKGDETVGTFPFSYDPVHDALHPEMSSVEPAHRRKGLATAVYVKAERFTGRPVEPSETQLLRGKALWAQPGRPFGKRFGEKRISSNDLSRIKDEDEFLASGAAEQMVRPSTRPPLGPIGRRIAERLGPQVTDQRLIEWRVARMSRMVEAGIQMRRAAKMIREEEVNAQSYVASYPGNTLPWHRAGGGPARRAPRRWSNSPRWDDVSHGVETPEQRAERARQGRESNLRSIDEWEQTGSITPEMARQLRGQHRMAGGPTFRVGDPDGLHMRPSAFLTKMARKFDAVVTARNETIGREALSPLLANEPMSMYGWMSLGARKGHRVELIGRGNEADKAVRALGKLIQNPRLTDLARSQIKNRGIFADIGRRSDGGDAGGQPYIVNELGREKFVPDRLRHLIPKDVWTRLPKRAGGSPVMSPWVKQALSNPSGKSLTGGLPGKALSGGGPFEIPGGERVFYAPENGWIIPAHLKNKIPHRAEGTPPGELGYEVPKLRMMRAAGPTPTGIPGASSLRATRQLQEATAAYEQGQQRYRQAERLQELSRKAEAERAAGADVYGQPRIAKMRVTRKMPAGAVGPGGTHPGGQFASDLYTPPGAEELFHTRQREAYAFNRTGAAPATSGLTGSAAYGREMDALLTAPRVNPAMRAGIQEMQISAQGRRGVTPRSLISSMSEFFAGGGKERATAGQEARNLRTALQSMVPAELQGSQTAMEHWSQRVHETGVTLTREQGSLTKLNETHKATSEVVKKQTKAVEGWRIEHEKAQGGLELATDRQKRFDAATAAASGGIAKNFLAATGGIAAFQLGMQGVTEGIRIAGEVTGPLVDRMTGFQATTTKVTSDLAAAAKETGNVPSVIAAAAGAGGLGTAGYAYVQGSLGAGVTAAGGANAAGQGMQLRRAASGARGNQAPTGMFGGYGGLLGSSFLSSEVFGGGKGFLENIAGEASGYRSQPGGGGIKVGNIGPLPFGAGGGNPSTSSEVTRALTVEFADYNEAVQRGSRYLGQNASSLQLMTKETLTATKGLAGWDQASANLKTFADQIGGTAPDEVQKLLAAGGVIVDSTGKAVSSAKDLMTFLSQSAQGTMLPTAQEYAAQQKIALQGAQAIADAQRQYAQQIQIPGQLGQQLAAQPLLPAQAGIATPAQMAAIGGRPGMGAVGAAGGYVQQSLAGTQKMQDQITQAGYAAIQKQRQFIEQNITTYTPSTGTATAAGAPDAAVAIGAAFQKVFGGAPGSSSMATRLEALRRTGRTAQPGPGIPEHFLGDAGGRYGQPGSNLWNKALGSGSTSSASPAPTSSAPSAGQTAGQDYAALYGDVNDVLGKGAPTIYAYGNAITALNVGIASRQTNLNVATYAESIRIMNRNIGYAKGVVTGQGATSGSNANLGALERLSFTLSRASESLSIALSQRQINFSVAVAGFQAPGITGQERGARTQEAMVQAQYGQAQLDIQKQQFTISKVVFDTQAQNALTDLSIQRSLSAQTFAVEQQTLADQKRISALQIVQGQLEAKAQAILDQAQTGFGGTLTSAGGFVSQFSGSIKDATDAIRGAIGLQPLYSTPTATAAAATAARTLPGLNTHGHASGLLGMTSGPTALGIAGEVAGEAVAILRNPRPLSASNPVSTAMGGGGGMTLNVTVTGNAISSDMDLEKLARVLAEKVEQRIGQKANLLNAPRAF